MVKPTRSVNTDGDTQSKRGAVHCRDKSQLLDVLASFPSSAYPLLLQQRIIGPGVGIFLLIWDGELVASFAHRRLRERPPAGGVSVYRESIVPEPSLLERSRALLDRFGWRGVAMIEYKVEQSSGVPWEWGGGDYLLARIRHNDRELSIPPGSPSRARAILSALVPWKRGDRLEVLRLDDPAPFLRETRQYFRWS